MERPHNISIGFSIFAALLSGISLWQSCQTTALTKASSRATVEITQVRATIPDLHLNGKQNVLKLQKLLGDNRFVVEGTVVNFGKVRATNIQMAVEGRDWGATQNGWFRHAAITIPDLAPGRSQLAYIPLNFAQQPPPSFFRLYGLLEYTDEGTGNRYHESWCYQSKGKAQPVAELVFCSEALPQPPTLPLPPPVPVP